MKTSNKDYQMADKTFTLNYALKEETQEEEDVNME